MPVTFHLKKRQQAERGRGKVKEVTERVRDEKAQALQGFESGDGLGDDDFEEFDEEHEDFDLTPEEGDT